MFAALRAYIVGMQAPRAPLVPPEACAAAREHAGATSTAALTVESVREYGYNSDTIKLSVHGVSSCLRLYEVDTDGNPTASETHIKQAVRAFAAHGLAPAVYAAGSGWSLEPWLGPTLESSAYLPEDMQTLGRLLAALHSSVPAAWFAPTREGVLRGFPAVQSHEQLHGFAPHAAARLALGVSVGGHMRDQAQIRMLADTSNAELLHLWASPNTALAPVHPAAQRVVTVHGDAHPRNLVRLGADDARIVFIDLELACVTQAVHDLALVLDEVTAHSGATNEQARANEETLLRAYLLASGFAEPDPAELEQLVLDCRIAHYCGLYLRARNLPSEPGAAAAVVRCVHGFAARARADASVRQSIIDAPHCASFFADTLGAQVHELGGRCKRSDPVPVAASV